MNINLNKYKSIILDCDGVILNSNKIKTRAFKLALKKYSKNEIDTFINYHKNNGGISRYVKFKYFYKNILKINKFEKEFEQSLKNYEKELSNNILLSKQDNFLIKFLNKYKNKNLIVCTASNEKELIKVFKKRKIYDFFDKIYGSPNSKFENIKIGIANKFILKPCVYIGDSSEDYKVAKKFKFDFIFKYPWSELDNWQEFVDKNRIKIIKNLNI